MSVRRCTATAMARMVGVRVSVSVALLIVLFVQPASASDQPYQSYIFDQWGNPVPTPAPYYC